MIDILNKLSSHFSTIEMAKRNNLFKTLNKNLKANGLGDDLAKDLAKEALRQNRGRRRPGGAGGQGDLTPPITIIEDSCDDAATVECDSSYKYRSIEGQCNNLDQTGFEGSAGMPFTRYAVVSDNMDPIKNMTIYLTKVGTSRKGDKGPSGGGSDNDKCSGDEGMYCLWF